MARCITFSSLEVEATKNMNLENLRSFPYLHHLPCKIILHLSICILSPCAYIIQKNNVLHICFTFFLLALFSSRVAIMDFSAKTSNWNLAEWRLGTLVKVGFGSPNCQKKRYILNEMVLLAEFVWVAKKNLCHCKNARYELIHDKLYKVGPFQL